MSIRHTLLRAIERDPKTVDELVAETQLTKAQVANNMRLIVVDEYATREADEGRLVYHVNAAGRDWLDQHADEHDTEQPATVNTEVASIITELSSATQSSQPAVEAITPATPLSEQPPPARLSEGGDSSLNRPVSRIRGQQPVSRIRGQQPVSRIRGQQQVSRIRGRQHCLLCRSWWKN